MNPFVTAFASVAIAFVLCVLCRMVAIRTGLVDRPSSNRAHTVTTPLLGGIGVALSTLFAYFLLYADGWSSLSDPFVRGYAVSAAFVTVLGFADDAGGLRPLSKLIGQLAAGLIFVFFAGLSDLSGGHALWTIALVIWIVFLTNAVNLLDNLDGLAAGTAVVSAAALAVIAWHSGNRHVLFLLSVLAGSAGGFLLLNFPPARMFLGDAGSMFLGLSLGVCAGALCVADGGLIIPCVLCLSYPIFDTVFVFLRRSVSGGKFYVGGTDHSSHILLSLMRSKRAVTMVILATSATASLAGVGSFWLAVKGQAVTGCAFLCMYAGYGVFLSRKAGTSS